MILKYLFSGGWMALWYLWIYLHVFPAKGLYSYFLGFQPGKGPQGGEVIALFGLMYAGSLYLLAGVNGMWLSNRLPGSGLEKWALSYGVLLGVTTLAIFLGVTAFNRLSAVKSETVIPLVLTVTSVTLAIGVNLWALARIRGLA